jgi:hypothetical protein
MRRETFFETDGSWRISRSESKSILKFRIKQKRSRFDKRLGASMSGSRRCLRAGRPMPHSFCFIRTDSTPEGRVWRAATGRRSGKRVPAAQRQLAAVFRRDRCWVSGAPWQSRQQAAGGGQHQAVENGDESPHSKRAFRPMRQKPCGLGRTLRPKEGAETQCETGIASYRLHSNLFLCFPEASLESGV